MVRSSPYPVAPGRLRHGTSQQDITLDDVFRSYQAGDVVASCSGGEAKPKLIRSTSKENIDTSMLCADPSNVQDKKTTETKSD